MQPRSFEGAGHGLECSAVSLRVSWGKGLFCSKQRKGDSTFGPVRPLTAPSSMALEGASICAGGRNLGDRRWIWGSGNLCLVKSHAHSP